MTKFKTLMQAVKAREEDEKGFTLIELIIVIAIIGILVAIAIPVYGSIQQNARNKTADAAAANGLTMAVAAAADGKSETDIRTAAGKAAVSGKIAITVTPAGALTNTITVTATTDPTPGTYTLTKGPHAKTGEF